jgi:hypothetical protein
LRDGTHREVRAARATVSRCAALAVYAKA